MRLGNSSWVFHISIFFGLFHKRFNIKNVLLFISPALFLVAICAIFHIVEKTPIIHSYETLDALMNNINRPSVVIRYVMIFVQLLYIAYLIYSIVTTLCFMTLVDCAMIYKSFPYLERVNLRWSFRRGWEQVVSEESGEESDEKVFALFKEWIKESKYYRDATFSIKDVITEFPEMSGARLIDMFASHGYTSSLMEAIPEGESDYLQLFLWGKTDRSKVVVKVELTHENEELKVRLIDDFEYTFSDQTYSCILVALTTLDGDLIEWYSDLYDSEAILVSNTSNVGGCIGTAENTTFSSCTLTNVGASISAKSSGTGFGGIIGSTYLGVNDNGDDQYGIINVLDFCDYLNEDETRMDSYRDKIYEDLGDIEEGDAKKIKITRITTTVAKLAIGGACLAIGGFGNRQHQLYVELSLQLRILLLTQD